MRRRNVIVWMGRGRIALRPTRSLERRLADKDRCFIKDIAEPSGEPCILQAIVNIAATRHITTTAEGVETEQELEMLRKLGCTEMQGYLFSPAIPTADVRRLLLSIRGRAVA